MSSTLLTGKQVSFCVVARFGLAAVFTSTASLSNVNKVTALWILLYKQGVFAVVDTILKNLRRLMAKEIATYRSMPVGNVQNKTHRTSMFFFPMTCWPAGSRPKEVTDLLILHKHVSFCVSVLSSARSSFV